MFKFYIGYTELQNNPFGWEDMSTTIRLDKELKGLFTIMDTSLTFYDDGHDILKQEYLSHGYCHKVTFEVRQMREDGNYYPIFTGLIFLRDVEFTEGIEGTFAKTQIQDNSFYAKIFNNRNLKAMVYAGRSKNDVPITPATYYRLNYFTPSTGAYIALITGGASEARNTTAFKVFDILKYLVDFMTDGTVDFVSDTFDVGGKYENYLITNGFLLRFVTVGGVSQELFQDHWPEISFTDVLQELDKEFNVGFVTSFNGATGTLRIEEYGYLFPTTIIENLTDIATIKHKPASEYLYGSVDVGSETITDESFLSFIYARFLGTQKETYLLTGECNNDRVFDLVNKWIIDTNTIEDLILNGQTTAPTSYDEDVFLIQATYDSGNIYKADQSNWLNIAPPYYYNETLINQAKILRHLGNIPNSIAQYFSADLNRFRASNTMANSIPAPIPGYDPQAMDDDFSGDNFDTGGNYDPSAPNYYFTNPSDAVLSFNTHLKIQIPPGTDRLRIRILRWDFPVPLAIQGGVLLYDQDISEGIYTLDLSGTFFSYANERIDLEIEYGLDGAASLLIGSYWECTNAGDGGVFATVDSSSVNAIRHIFSDYPLSNSRFKDINTDPRGLIGIGINAGKKYYAGIEELKYKPYKKQISSAIMLSNEEINS